MKKIQLSWQAHVDVAPRHRPDFLDDIRELGFDWDGDSFWIKSEDFIKVHTKHWIDNKGKSQIQVPSIQSRGLGDTVAKAADFFGFKPCNGCKDRQRKLNKLVPY
jgi:hypothetical protein